MISNIFKSDVHVSQHGSFAHSLIMFFEDTNIYETKNMYETKDLCNT